MPRARAALIIISTYTYCMFGMGECTNFGTPKKRLSGGVTGFYGPPGGALARYSALVGGLERPFRFKWGGSGAEEYMPLVNGVWDPGGGLADGETPEASWDDEAWDDPDA